MRVCGVEIKSNEAILCLMASNQGLFELPDCRSNRLQLVNDQDPEQIRKFQFALAKLAEDYRISHFVIRERPQKGKFAGSAIGFKIEAALQLIPSVETVILSSGAIKESLSRHPVPIDFKETGLKGFQEPAFISAYAFLAK
ncbi:DUF3010 family protein [Rheinheimera sp.]|uniref:DUF3010 family protein n=1 Tax=Rheinheimera sp. TaxID=1869214 RepID=UPI00307FC365